MKSDLKGKERSNTLPVEAQVSPHASPDAEINGAFWEQGLSVPMDYRLGLSPLLSIKVPAKKQKKEQRAAVGRPPWKVHTGGSSSPLSHFCMSGHRGTGDVRNVQKRSHVSATPGSYDRAKTVALKEIIQEWDVANARNLRSSFELRDWHHTASFQATDVSSRDFHEPTRNLHSTFKINDFPPPPPSFRRKVRKAVDVSIIQHPHGFGARQKQLKYHSKTGAHRIASCFSPPHNSAIGNS